MLQKSCLVHRARPAIIGGNGQSPVSVGGIEIFKKCGGRARRCIGVASLIHQRRHLQTQSLCRREHELPQACGTVARHRVRIESRLHHRQIFELQRKPLLFESLLEDRHIIVRQAEHSGHLGAATLHISVDIFAHYLIVRQVDHGGQSRKPGSDGLVGSTRVALFRIAVVGGGIVFHIPAVEKPLRIGLETFRKNYLAVGNRLLQLKHTPLLRGYATQREEGKGEYDN